jgi:hypothetical protein
MIGTEPESSEKMDADIEAFRRTMFFAIAREAEMWRANQLAEREKVPVAGEAEYVGSGRLVLEGRGNPQSLETPIQ